MATNQPQPQADFILCLTPIGLTWERLPISGQYKADASRYKERSAKWVFIKPGVHKARVGPKCKWIRSHTLWVLKSESGWEVKFQRGDDGSCEIKSLGTFKTCAAAKSYAAKSYAAYYGKT